MHASITQLLVGMIERPMLIIILLRPCVLIDAGRLTTIVRKIIKGVLEVIYADMTRWRLVLFTLAHLKRLSLNPLSLLLRGGVMITNTFASL